MTIKQLLLLTSLLLLLTLGMSLNISERVQKAQQEEKQAKQEAIEARKLSLESEQYETQLMNITMYAPLSPGSVKGRDYSGDPSITYSGEKLVPGETAAAGPNIPFGTKIYVEGLGWYTVQDRGSAIGPNDIDLAVSARDEAIKFGQQQRLVIFQRQ